MDASRYESMAYRRAGRSGLRLPAVSLGLWHNFGSVDPFETARDIVLRAFDLGITHFDLANNYGPVPGSAEETFGRILRRDLARHRDELIVSTQGGVPDVAWPLRRRRLAQVSARQPGPEPGPAGDGLRGRVLSREAYVR